MTDYCQDFSDNDDTDQRRRWRKNLGAIGETIAARYLEHIGWQIDRRSFRHGRSTEADLIAVDQSGLKTVIEVKTRSFRAASSAATKLSWYESAVQSIDREKRRRLITVTQRFHALFDQGTSGYRLDVIFIGIHSNLVVTLNELRQDDSHEFHQLVASSIRDFFEGDDDKLQIIHCQEAFVTKS